MGRDLDVAAASVTLGGGDSEFLVDADNGPLDADDAVRVVRGVGVIEDDEVSALKLGQLPKSERAPGCEQNHGTVLLGHLPGNDLDLVERRWADLVYSAGTAGAADHARIDGD